MKITALEESADFATLDTKKLFSKLKSHELSHKGHPNHDASFTSKALITSGHVDGHDANPTNTISPSLDLLWLLLLARKFWAMHKFQKEMRRNSQNSQGSFECWHHTLHHRLPQGEEV
jgi:hypothetical protein